MATRSCPCFCGHPHTLSRPCLCGCSHFLPDYEAQAKQDGRTLPPSVVAYVRQLRRQWRGPKTTERACLYCQGTFRSERAATTCSPACRTALSRARAYETPADVPTPAIRAESFSRERKAATGYGLMTSREQYEADLRVMGVKPPRDNKETS